VSSTVLPSHRPRAELLRTLAKRWHFGLLAAGAFVVGAPIGLLAHGTERARACVASYEAPRGPALPDCKQTIRWFVTPSRVPWTATPARYRAEEVSMRAAIAGYQDAAVGRPDAKALAPAADALAAAEKVIKAGSQRVALEELGRAVGAPDVGRSAMLLGDRRTLIDRADQWPHWSVRFRALDAALVDGDVPRAFAIAKRYAEFDPRDEDLRVAVASVLCLGPDPKRGLELLQTVQADRAKDRHESWARNWGEVRSTMVACAAKAGLPAPPMPDRSDAGSGDAVEARTALRLRLLGRAHEGDTPLRRDAGFSVIQMLKKTPMKKGERVRMLAALMASGHPIDPNLTAAMAAPHLTEGEPPLLPAAAGLTAVEWLAEPRGLHVLASADMLRDALTTLLRMAESGDLSEEERRTLLDAVRATAVDAARAFALAGDGAAADAIVDRARAHLGAAQRGLVRSSAWYVAGDPARALDAMDQTALSREGLPWGREPGKAEAPEERALHVAWMLQRAEIEASLGKRDEAGRDAVTADALAAAGVDRALDVRVQWARLAFAGIPRAPVPMSATEAWPWVGTMATPTSWLDAPAESPDALARALSHWAAARRASPEDRRAVRYAAFARHAGEAPRSWAPYLLLAGDLLAPGEGDVEVWLDAFSATASRSIPMRAYAWARMEAARMRGDAAAAAAWKKRYDALCALASPADNMEMAAALGI
jgi:hypothetical protein